MKKKESQFANVTNPSIHVSSQLRNVIDIVLNKKFGRKNQNGIKDDCDSCGEKCFD